MRPRGTAATTITKIATAAVFACALAFYLGFSNYGFHREDEGALLLQFWRYAGGDVPYRDFHVGYTPGVYFVHKTLMQWFGPGLMPGRYLLAFVNSASAALLFVLTVRMTSSWRWALVAPLLYVSAVPVHVGNFAAFNIPYPTWYNLFFFALSAMILPRLAAGPTTAHLLACGVLAGIGFAFKPNVGLFQLAATALVCLHAHGRPRTRFERALWWTWWFAILGGLFAVFSSAQSVGELVGFLAPAVLVAVAVARDAHRAPSREGGVALLACALTMAAGFLAVCVPWLAWSYSILGPDWFTRRALFLGTGFESVYYLTGPPLEWGIAAVIAGAAAWLLPAWLDRRGWRAWPLPLIAVAVGVVAFAYLAATRPMPEGLYSAVMNVVEPNVFVAALSVQLAMLLLWLARPAALDHRRTQVFGPTLICGVMLYLQVFPRTDLMHWVSASPLLFPSAVWLLQSLARRWSSHGGTLVRRAVGTAVLLPVVAIALLRVGHFLDARWDMVDGRPVRTPETMLSVAHAPLAINAGRAQSFRDLEAAVSDITSHSSPADPVFTFPALDYVSYLSLRRPGSRHGYYFPGWPGHDTEAEVLASLERKHPRLAVMLYEPQLYFSAASAYYFLFADFFESNYERVARRGPYAIFAPSEASEAGDGDTADTHAAPFIKDPSAAPGPTQSAQPTAIADALGSQRMQELTVALTSPDANVRLAAVQRMNEWQILGDFEPLRSALADADPAVRSAAVQAAPHTRSIAMRDALLGGVAERAFDVTDSVLAIRATNGNCDASCVPTLLRLTEGYDQETAVAARGALGELPASRWQSDFWWKWEGDGNAPFDDATVSRLTAALENPDSDHELRILAFAFADRLGLAACSDTLRSWSDKRTQQVGPDFTVVTALNHLSRASCDGPWLETALRWLPLDPTLAPRIALREAHKHPDDDDDDDDADADEDADAMLAGSADARLGSASALAQWICGMVGGKHCLAAARSTLVGSPSEEERVAAAWAWAQLATDEAGIAQLLAQVATDSSPQVRETARYGIATRHLRQQRRQTAHGFPR